MKLLLRCLARGSFFLALLLELASGACSASTPFIGSRGTNFSHYFLASASFRLSLHETTCSDSGHRLSAGDASAVSPRYGPLSRPRTAAIHPLRFGETKNGGKPAPAAKVALCQTCCVPVFRTPRSNSAIAAPPEAEEEPVPPAVHQGPARATGASCPVPAAAWRRASPGVASTGQA